MKYTPTLDMVAELLERYEALPRTRPAVVEFLRGCKDRRRLSHEDSRAIKAMYYGDGPDESDECDDLCE